MASQRFDVVVVGSGPGGYVAAIRAAQLGLSVAAVEDDRPGGVCLNWGCIPTKALLRNAEVLHLVQHADRFGITIASFEADYAEAVRRSRQVADRMAKGVEFLFKKNRITVFPGTGRLASSRTVVVAGKGNEETILEAASGIILATGSEPKSLPGVTIDERRIVSSNGAVRAEAKPGSLVIIGAGAVGMEFADVYAAYGVQVTVLEALPRVLPLEDEEAGAQVARLFARRNVTVRTGVTVRAVKPDDAGVSVEVEADGKGERLRADQVLMAVGRAARTRGIGLEAQSVTMERGFVKVTAKMETSVKGVYAVGDMAGNQLLAHKAMAEGVVAAEAIAGRSPHPVDYGNIPSCTYCRPQVASIGLTEARAKESGRALAVGRFPFTANGKAVALGEPDGFLKVIADKATGEILGVHIVGSEATELIHEFAVGRTLETTLEEMIHTVHAHPTLSEAALEAVLAALGQAIHI
jgi:dihydrolipoamide dehydrogenase